MPQFGVSLADDSRVIIYDCNMFIVQANGRKKFYKTDTWTLLLEAGEIDIEPETSLLPPEPETPALAWPRRELPVRPMIELTFNFFIQGSVLYKFLRP
jgi:hypothetical protein